MTVRDRKPVPLVWIRTYNSTTTGDSRRGGNETRIKRKKECVITGVIDGGEVNILGGREGGEERGE